MTQGCATLTSGFDLNKGHDMVKDSITKKVLLNVDTKELERFALALLEKMSPNFEGDSIIGKFSFKGGLTRYMIYDRVPSHIIGVGQIIPGNQLEEEAAVLPGFFREAVIIDLRKGSIQLGLGADFIDNLKEKFAETYTPLIRQYNIPVSAAIPMFKKVRRD